MWRYRDPFVQRLADDMCALVDGDSVDATAITERLLDLAARNCAPVRRYWDTTRRGRGVPDRAFRAESMYFFPDELPARVFTTSGTSGATLGRALYSPRGLELMRRSILHQARVSILQGLDRPVIVRLVPREADAPQMIMAYGMEQISETFGDRELSASVVTKEGIDIARLEHILDRAVEEHRPVVLIGGSFAYVDTLATLEERGRRWQLPSGSRMVDAGGFKGRVKAITVDALKSQVWNTFGIPSKECINIFGMTELASQLYDAFDESVGPLGERPKARTRYVEPRVLDGRSMRTLEDGLGLLEVTDRCILDRPCVVLTGDLAIAGPYGTAIVGRVEPGKVRGCSLALDALTAPPHLRANEACS